MSNDSSRSAEAIHLFPYQLEMVERVTNAGTPARFLLSSPPGAGKSFAMVALANALRARNESSRCLAIVPGPFLLMWQEDLRRFGGIDSLVMTLQTYRRLQSETTKEFNVWSKVPSAVASIDFVKSAPRIEEMLAERWDLIIIDEIQSCSASSQRGEVAKRIWKDSAIPFVVAATGIPNRPDWLFEDTHTQRIHWNNTAIARFGIMPKRRFNVINYTTTNAEREIRRKISGLIANVPKTSQDDFVEKMLLRCLESSMYAFEQLLRRLLGGEPYTDQSKDDEEIKSDDIMESRFSMAAGLNDIVAEQMAELLETESKDSKWDCCEKLLRNCGIGEECSGVIFTDFADTAQYLEYLTKTLGLKSFLITGLSTLKQRQRALEGAKTEPSVLIATTAVEGVSFAFTNQVIHYDLPWEPMAFLRRSGRVERLGSKFEEIQHYSLLPQENEKEVWLNQFLNDVKNLEMAWS